MILSRLKMRRDLAFIAAFALAISAVSQTGGGWQDHEHQAHPSRH